MRLAARGTLIATMSLSCVVSRSQNSGTCAAARVPVLPGRFFLSVCHGGTKMKGFEDTCTPYVPSLLMTCLLLHWPPSVSFLQKSSHRRSSRHAQALLVTDSLCCVRVCRPTCHSFRCTLHRCRVGVHYACFFFFFFVFYTKKCACTMDWKFRRPASALPVCFCERWRKFACQW